MLPRTLFLSACCNALLACTAPAKGRALHDAPPATPTAPPPSSAVASAAPSAPPAAAGSASAAAPSPPTRDADKLISEPTGPRPARAEIAGSAALVWETTPAPPNPNGPIGRDRIVTRLVVEDGATAKVIAERPEPVFWSKKTLWHLRARKLRSYGCDCRRSSAEESRPNWVRRKDLDEIVFESLEPKPRVIEPMGSYLSRPAKCEGNEALPWARLDLDGMVGPYAMFTIDYYTYRCSAAHPEGSAARQTLDLESGLAPKFTEPPGLRAKLLPIGERLLAKSCRGSGGPDDKTEDDREGFAIRYDSEGDLVAEYGFLGYTFWACNHGIVHVRVGSFELPQELVPYGRLPIWLRGWLKAHPATGVAVIAAGGEEQAKTQLLALPKQPKPLPADSGATED